jgi:hypothetical protein
MLSKLGSIVKLWPSSMKVVEAGGSGEKMWSMKGGKWKRVPI